MPIPRVRSMHMGDIALSVLIPSVTTATTLRVVSPVAGWLERIIAVREGVHSATEVITVTKDWLFGRGTRKGLLRCVATARTFLEPYQAIFDEVHRRLRRN